VGHRRRRFSDQRSSQYGMFLIGGSMFCALGALLVDRGAQRFGWGRSRVTRSAAPVDKSPLGPATPYTSA